MSFEWFFTVGSSSGMRAAMADLPPPGTLVAYTPSVRMQYAPWGVPRMNDLGRVVCALDASRVFVSFPDARRGFPLWMGRAQDLSGVPESGGESDRILRVLYEGRKALKDEERVTFLGDDGSVEVAHSCVLSAASEVFCRVISSDFRESRERTLRLSGVSAEAMARFVEGIYLGGFERLDVSKLGEISELLVVFGLADQYMLEALRQSVANRLTTLMYRCAVFDDFATFLHIWKCGKSRGFDWIHDVAAQMISATDQGVPYDARALGGNPSYQFGTRLRDFWERDESAELVVSDTLSPFSKRRRV